MKENFRSNALVRRHEPPPVPTAPFTADLYPAQEHGGHVFAVRTEVVWPSITSNGSLRGPPQILLQWQFRPGMSGTIVGFRRSGGFGHDDDQGELIVESRSAGKKIEQINAGEYFYTFCIRRGFPPPLIYIRLHEVRFSASVPSI